MDSGIVVSDADSAVLPSATVRIMGGYVSGQDLLSLSVSGYATSFDAATGTLTITAEGGNSITNAVLRAVRYTNTSDNPTGGTRTIQFVVSDGIDNSLAATKLLNLTPTNDPALLDLNGAGAGTGSSATYNEAAPQPVQLAPAATLTDADGGGYAGGSLVVTLSANPDANARLHVLNQGNGAGQIGVSGSTISYGGVAIATKSGGDSGLTPLTITFNANATLAAVEAVVRQIAYTNNNANPPTTGPTFAFTLTDGSGAQSTPVGATVINQGTGEPPYVSIHEYPKVVLEPTTSDPVSFQIDPQMSVYDSDSSRLPSATFQITGNYVIGEDALYYSAIGSSVQQSFDPQTGTLTLTASANGSITHAVLRSVYYRNSSDTPAPLDRTITVIVSDGVNTSAPVSKTLTIVPQDDPVTLDANGPDDSSLFTTTAHLLGATPTPVAPDAIIFDPDSPLITENGRLYVVLSGAAGGDTLGQASLISRGNGPGQIGVSGNAVSYEGTVIGTLSGAGTVAERLTVTFNAAATPEGVQAAIRAVGYSYPAVSSPSSQYTVGLYFEPTSGPAGSASVTVKHLTTSTPVFESPASGAPLFGSGLAAGGWASQDDTPRAVADINGDGRADVIGFGYERVYALIDLDDPSAVHEVSSGFVASPAGGGWTSQDQYPRTFADVNGDGRADLIAFGEEGVAVALSTGTSVGVPFYGLHAFGAGPGAGSWNSFDRYPRLLADVNGDGRADIVGFGEDTVYTALGKADGTFELPVEAVDGFGASAAGGGWSSFDEFPRSLADLNADGNDDLIGFGSGGVYVALANGDGTFADPVFSRPSFGSAPEAGGWSSFDEFPRMAGDVNGDGFADLVGFGDAGVIVALGRGDGSFMPPELELAGFGAAQGWTSQDSNPRMLADFTGDGILDIVGFGDSGIHLAEAWYL